MNILSKARALEEKLARTLNGAAQEVTDANPLEPLELIHAIVDAVEAEIQPGGRGKHVFPFNRLKVSVAAPTRDAWARLEAVLDGEPSLRDRIVERLHAAACNARDLTLTVSYLSQTQPEWKHPAFHVEFARVTAASPTTIAPAAPEVHLELEIVAGTAEASTYSFAHTRIDLGRRTEVRDHRNRLIRTNHVAFADSNGRINDSVSRRHAHIEYLEGSGEYRVYDDGSAHGTGVVRNGRTIVVPLGSRGIRLQSDDDIVLGEARIRVKIERGS
jgi:FHA domain